MNRFLIFVMILASAICIGQEANPYKFTSVVDLYEFPAVGATGNLDAQIPLFNISTKGFELPLSLIYDQMGNTNAFYIGNQFGDAWVLNAIGTIRREVSNNRTISDATVYGSILCGNPGVIWSSFTGRKFMMGPYIPDELYFQQNSNEQYRLSPDHFTFSFMGLSGKFTIFNDNGILKAQILESTDFAKIEVVQPTGWELINTIYIYDKNGYKYKFSSPTNNNQNNYFETVYLNHTVMLDAGCYFSLQLNHSPALIPESEAGAVVIPEDYIISRRIFTDAKKFWRNLELTEIYDKYNMLLLSYEYDTVGMGNGDSGNRWVNGLGLNQSSQKLFLKKINIINQGSVIFTNTYGLNGSNVVNSYTNTMELKDLKNNLIKKFTFDFLKKEIIQLPYIKDYKDGAYLSFQKRLLTGVKEYNSTSNGFLNTSIAYKDALINNTNSLIDRYGFLTKKGYCNLHLSRDNYKANSFILQKIKYPTGGSVVYEFEPNMFSNNFGTTHYNGRNYDNHIYETLPLTQLSDRVTFIANENDKIYVINKGFANSALYKTVSGALQYIQGTINAYAQETEICKHELPSIVLPTSQNNIYTIKNSSNYISTSDIIVYRFKLTDTPNNFRYAEGNRIAKMAYFKDNVNNNILNTPAGELTAEKVIKFDYSEESLFNASSGRVRFTYDSDYEMKPFYIVYDKVVTNLTGIGKQYAKYNFPYTSSWEESVRTDINESKLYNLSGQLLSENTYTYTYGLPIYHSTAYTHIPKPFIASSTVINKNYEGSVFTSTSSYSSFNSDNRLLSSSINEENLGKITKTEFTYQTINNAILNTQTNNYVNNSLTDQIKKSYDWLGRPTTTEFKTPEMSNYEQIGATNYHYHNGLLQGYTTLDGTPVTFVYGYNETQLVAKIVNVSATVYYATPGYGSIRSNIEIQSNQNSTGYSEVNLKTTLNSLRATFPNALVTSYTYKPMVGVSSVTDENGKTTTYEYDTFNRLATVKDYLGNILKEYQYNFTN